MEIAFVRADDDDGDDVRLRKENRIHKSRAVSCKHEHTHTFVLMLLWTSFGRLLSYLRRWFVTKEVAASMQQHFPWSTSSSCVFRSTCIVIVCTVHTMKKWSEENQTKQKGNVTNKQKGFVWSRLLRSVWTFVLSAFSVVLCLALSITLNRSCSFIYLNQFYMCFSRSSTFLLLFRFICTICSALLFAVCWFYFSVIVVFRISLDIQHKTKQHKQAPPRMNFYFLRSFENPENYANQFEWKEFKRRPNEQTFLWGYVERVTLR